MPISDLTIEQKVIYYLTKIGLIPNLTEAWEALRNPDYADFLVTGNGLSDEFGSESADCDHESLSVDEIQEVFDNDEEQNK